jgi:hypothetical protein
MSDPEQKGNGRRAEQETVRTTIVGGRPPGAGKPLGNVPRGIEVLIKKAAVDPQFRPLLLEKRAKAAKTIGLELRPSEIAMLAGIPQAQLEAIISRTRVDAKLRPILMGAAAAVMLVALGTDLTGCNKGQPAQPVQKNTKEPIVCGGSRPDEPLQNSTPATTNSSPAATQGSAADTNAVTNPTRPIMPVEGGSRPSRPLSTPDEEATPGSPATTNATPATTPGSAADTDAVVKPPQMLGGVRPDRP